MQKLVQKCKCSASTSASKPSYFQVVFSLIGFSTIYLVSLSIVDNGGLWMLLFMFMFMIIIIIVSN